MATIVSKSDRVADNTAYHLVRRAQASIASYQHFGGGDLNQYLARDSFAQMAARLADHYFHRSKDLQSYKQVAEIYMVLLVMAPILQRLPLSFKIDWHRGHLLSFVRINSNGRGGRFYVAVRQVERSYQPDLLAANLEAMGIHDAAIVVVLLDLYRRHCGGSTLQHRLAHQLFDSIILATEKQGYELRFANQMLRMEKGRFDGSIDLRHESLTLLDYSLRSVEHKGGYGLEILISYACIAEFRLHVERIMNAAASPEYKLTSVKGRISDFVERTRSARSAKPQILELKHWLGNKVRSLAATNKEAKTLPELLINLWLQRVDSSLYFKEPNFFLNYKQYDEKTFIKLFSPYREG